jgi:flavin reductase (DIM6/NTAB) family NADH-FMN oxidoreductase RutF
MLWRSVTRIQPAFRTERLQFFGDADNAYHAVSSVTPNGDRSLGRTVRSMIACNVKVKPRMIDPAEFRAAMRELAAGVAIVTAGSGACRRGMTATAVCSLSATPPALLVCVNRDADCHKTILEYGAFCVNLLGSAGETLASRFAGRTGERGAERFGVGRWGMLSTGAPVLQDAVASFDCILRETVDAGTHSIFIGDVDAVTTGAGNSALVYRGGRFSSVE